MNWLGKVFVVLILIMSVLFMGLSMAVYATHRNWREVIEGPNGLRAQLTQANERNEQLKSEHNRRVEELAREREAAEQQLAKLESEQVLLAQNNQQLQNEVDQRRQQQGEAIAAVAATQALNQNLTNEATTLRQNIRAEQQARDAAFTRTLAATEELHQLAGQYTNQRERYEDLTKQAAGMTHLLREGAGLDPATDPSGVVPTVDGVVSQVRRSGGALYVEVTVGADDGLRQGNTLEVFRGSRYLGRAQVLQTTPDRSVAVIDRRFQQGQIQEGDRVATRLRLN
jgi:hypothetical protein